MNGCSHSYHKYKKFFFSNIDKWKESKYKSIKCLTYFFLLYFFFHYVKCVSASALIMNERKKKQHTYAI